MDHTSNGQVITNNLPNMVGLDKHKDVPNQTSENVPNGGNLHLVTTLQSLDESALDRNVPMDDDTIEENYNIVNEVSSEANVPMTEVSTGFLGLLGITSLIQRMTTYLWFIS